MSWLHEISEDCRRLDAVNVRAYTAERRIINVMRSDVVRFLDRRVANGLWRRIYMWLMAFGGAQTRHRSPLTSITSHHCWLTASVGVGSTLSCPAVNRWWNMQLFDTFGYWWKVLEARNACIIIVTSDWCIGALSACVTARQRTHRPSSVVFFIGLGYCCMTTWQSIGCKVQLAA